MSSFHYVIILAKRIQNNIITIILQEMFSKEIFFKGFLLFICENKWVTHGRHAGKNKLNKLCS